MPPKRRMVASSAARMAARSRMSMEAEVGDLAAVLRLDFLGDGLGAFDVAVGDHDVGAAFGGEEGDLAADAAASADDESDLAGELLLGWLAADFGFFELPSTRCGRLRWAEERRSCRGR